MDNTTPPNDGTQSGNGMGSASPASFAAGFPQHPTEDDENQEEGEDDYGDDEMMDHSEEDADYYNEADPQGQPSQDGQSSGGRTENKSPLLSSEEDPLDTHNQDKDEDLQDDSDVEVTSVNPSVNRSVPFLPPGITFQRKVPPVPNTVAVRPNVKLPPGVSFQPKARPSPMAVRPTRGQSPFKPQRNVGTVSDLLKSIGVPTGRAMPMRAPRPKPNHGPRMMIGDFLQQHMQVSGLPAGLHAPKARPSRPRPPKPQQNDFMKSLLQNIQKAKPGPSFPGRVRPQTPVKKSMAGIQLPPGISMKPKVVEVGTSDSDLEESPPFPAPPDVRKRVEHRVTPLVKEPPAPVQEKSSIKLPPGISIERSLPRNVQLPPGISLERKKAETVVAEEEDELGDEAGMSEPDAFDENEHEEDEFMEESENNTSDELSGPQTEKVAEQPPVEPTPAPAQIPETSDPIEEPASENQENEVDESMETSNEDLSDSADMENRDMEENNQEESNGGADNFMPEDQQNESPPQDRVSENEAAYSNPETEREEGEVPMPGETTNQEIKEEPVDYDNLIAALSVENGDNNGDKDVMKNLVEMMSKGEIEGEIEDDKEDDEEFDEEKKAGKRKAEGDDEEEDGVSKSKKALGEEEDEDGEEIDKSKVASTHLRKNIREVMDETKLDETTLAAQRQEAERLKRLQEQQKILRDVQRSIQMSKHAAKNQSASAALSLLKGNTETSILKMSSSSSAGASSSASTPSHVLLKMANGQQTSLSDKMRELLKAPGRGQSEDWKTSADLLKQGKLSSSVTIAPIKKEPMDEEKKKKKGDVVTLSSDSDDDDCIVLSEEEIESEPEDDPTNSGMHTTDRYNKPDDQGRVLINTGHPAEESDIFLAPQIARIIKPHQIGGVRFLYDNIIESTQRFDSSSGFGCILAHSMGLGKTLQIVSFADIFMRHTSGRKILCIMPINTIQNWQAEFNMWLPKENPQEDVRCRDFDLYIVNESSKNIHSRGKVIMDWHRTGGVLLMGYELFRLLSLRKPIKSKRKRPDEIEIEKNRQLVEDVYAALVKPGPDLVICDEGHRIKNSHATTSQALKQIRTKRRVVLTGYPLQNNLLEYWCMVDFVRPNYLGSKTEFSNMFERPIQNGQCIDSTPQDKRLMRYRAHVLHSLLEGFVQRRSHAVLQEVLPQKEEYVLLLRFTAFQRQLYDTFMNDVVRTVAVPNPLKAFAVCCKIWNHPDVLFKFLKKKGEQRDLELEEPLPPSILPPHFPFGGAGFGASPNFAPTPPVPWPKKGPGSRGGKVRGKKAAMAANQIQSTPLAGEKSRTENVKLPSISQFGSPKSDTFRGHTDAQTYPATSAPSTSSASNYQQSAFYPPQQQQSSFNPHQTENFPFHNSNYENPDQFNSSPQKMFNPELMGNNQQKSFSSYGSDSGFFPQSNSSFSSVNQQQPYYQQNEMPAFDYSHGTTADPINHEFDQMSAFSTPSYDSSSFGSTGTEFQQPTQGQQGSQQQQQHNFWGANWPSTSQGSGYTGGGGGSSGDEFISPSKFGFEGEKKDGCGGYSPFGSPPSVKSQMGDEKKDSVSLPATLPKTDDEKKEEMKVETPKKDDIPYEWATELFKNYVTGLIENSSKMEVFFLILTESVKRQDRILVFSQSLLTLDLIEEYMQRQVVPDREEHWAKGRNYFRLDGSTPAMERERLINEFNQNPNVKVFLVSTRAGSLGINLVGANRVVVFDASWNPCHDTQAVCRVYRYGQKKQCYVYRLVMDCCLEKKIYDRQINKQGMADRVVDELNPDAHLSIKEVTNLCWDDQEETSVKDFSEQADKYRDDIVKQMVAKLSSHLSKAPFQHESLLIDRKEKKLSKAEKRLAKRSYELEKQSANQPKNMFSMFPSSSGLRNFSKPIASVKPMQSGDRYGMPSRSKWIPAEVWQKQGMSAQEMTLPLDVVIPTNSPDKTSIVLKAGQRVMVLKSPKGIYMQLESGKIIAIRTAYKVGQGDKADDKKPNPIAAALKNNPNVTITPKRTLVTGGSKVQIFKSSLDKKAAAINMAASKGRVAVNNKNRVIPNKQRVVNVATKDKIILGKKPDDPLKDDELELGEVSKEVGKTKEADADTETADGLQVSPHESLLGDFGKSGESSNALGSSGNSHMGDDFPSQDFGNLLDAQHPPSDVLGAPAPTVSDLANSCQQMSGDSLPTDLGHAMNTAPLMASDWKPPTEEMPRDIAKESLDSLNTMAKAVPTAEPATHLDKPVEQEATFPVKAESEESKKDDSVNPWQKPGYPVDPYGSYYPGYPGYYGPMPGYEGYPYPRGFPPHVKTETPEGSTPPPAQAPPPAAPPLYPPYPNPYPYPYNYPPYPPQAQPAVQPPPAPVPVPAAVKPPVPDPAAYAPPFTRPPYPAPTAAPAYYNYPPYHPPRPFHDPNYPYPNYNPYMPPGYGYPMQAPHPMQPQTGADGTPPAPSNNTTT